MSDNRQPLSPAWIVLLAVLGPVAAGLILDYIRERRQRRQMLES